MHWLQAMILKTTGALARVAALFACKWFFASMFELMLLKIVSVSTRIVTVRTPERLLFRMSDHVFFEGISS